MNYPSNEDQNKQEKENLGIVEQSNSPTEESQNANLDEVQLNDYPGGANNYPSPDNSIDNNNKKEESNILLDILIGLGITIIEYAIIISSLFLGLGIIIVGSVATITLAVVIFLSIKLIRKNHKLAGTLALVLISPIILFLLLFGACGLMFKF